MYDNLITRLQRRGIQARISGTTLWVCCPFCTLRGTTADTRFRLGIEIKGGRVPKGTAFCFNCRYPKGWSFQRAQSTLQKLLGNSFSHLTEEQPQPVKETLPELPEDFEELTGPEDYWTGKAWQYLLQRGMTGQQIKDHGVGLSLLGRAAGRVVFPIYNSDKLAGWTARTLGKQEPKWLHSSGLKDPYWASRANMPSLIITEGVFDALAVERVLNHAADVMALLGTNLTEHKASQISRYNHIILWLDPDTAGRKATIGLAAMLAEQGTKVDVVYVDPLLQRSVKKLDPGEMTPLEIDSIYSYRKPWSKRLALRLSYQ